MAAVDITIPLLCLQCRVRWYISLPEIKQSPHWASVMSTQTAEDGRRWFFLLPIAFLFDPTDLWASDGVHRPFCLLSPSSSLYYPSALLPWLRQVAPRCQGVGNGELVPDSSLIDPWSFTEGCVILVPYYAKHPFPPRMAVKLKEGG